jgi:hypothetical protein
MAGYVGSTDAFSPGPRAVDTPPRHSVGDALRVQPAAARLLQRWPQVSII